jgi:hypothetical protein
MNYVFKASDQYWRAFYGLSASQKESVRKAWKIFKENPFDSRLRPHKINKLSAHYDTTVYAVEVEADLRVVFCLKRNVVFTIDIGTHDVYKG